MAGSYRFDDAEQLLGLGDAGFGQDRRMVLFVEQIVAGRDLGFLVLMAAFELRNDLVGGEVFVGRFVRSTGDDERCTGFVDEDRVDFVDDREIVVGLDEGIDVELHIIAKIIEAEFVVRTVRDRACIGVLTLDVVHVVLDTADGQAEKCMDLAHPLGVA